MNCAKEDKKHTKNQVDVPKCTNVHCPSVAPLTPLHKELK